MKGKTLYRMLLVVVLTLAVVYTLGVIGLVPFKWSEYITGFMVLLFILLRVSKAPRA